MKVFIFTDLEGISGLAASVFINGDRPDLRTFAFQRMAADINACVEGCFQAGATEVIVRDGHGAGCNVHAGMIDPRVDLIQGAVPRKRFPGIEGAEALILLGYHGMAGTEGAVMEHTFSSLNIQGMWLNGRKVGEIGIDAAIGAEYGVPTVLVTGDDKACREAADWIPGVVTCQVKEGFDTQGARLYPLVKAEEAITRAAREALIKRREIAPIAVKRPVTLRWEMVERRGTPPGPDVVRFDARTYERTGDSVEKLLLD